MMFVLVLGISSEVLGLIQNVLGSVRKCSAVRSPEGTPENRAKGTAMGGGKEKMRKKEGEREK